MQPTQGTKRKARIEKKPSTELRQTAITITSPATQNRPTYEFDLPAPYGRITIQCPNPAYNLLFEKFQEFSDYCQDNIEDLAEKERADRDLLVEHFDLTSDGDEVTTRTVVPPAFWKDDDEGAEEIPPPLIPDPEPPVPRRFMRGNHILIPEWEEQMGGFKFERD